MLNYRQSALVRLVARRHGLKTHTPGHIDDSSFGEPKVLKHTSISDIPQGAPFFLRGWAIDLGRKRTPWSVSVEIDGKEVPARMRLQLPRPDVAAIFGSPNLLLSGFTAFVDTRSLAVGPHDLNIRAVVGRYGTAFARIPGTTRFFILNQFAASSAPPSYVASGSGAYHLDPVPIVATGSVLELTGSGLDDRCRPFTSVAARIDEDFWNEGWTGIQRSDSWQAATRRASAPAGFCVRIRLDTTVAGSHDLRLAGKTFDGQWKALGECRPLVVTNAYEPLPPWARALSGGGDAFMTDGAGTRLTQIELYRVGAAISFKGILSRATAVGRSVCVVAQDSHNGEFSLPTWSAPTNDPKMVLFGGEIPARALTPAKYRLLVDASEASQRYMGRADTGCELVVKRADRPEVRRLLGGTL